jgi:hypothetical protein
MLITELGLAVDIGRHFARLFDDASRDAAG